MKRLLALALLGVALAGCVNERSFGRSVRVHLHSTNRSHVRGDVVLSATDGSTRATMTASGLAPSSTAHVVLNAGTCSAPGASIDDVARLKANRDGSAFRSGLIRFRGTENVTLASIADGEHVMRILAPDEVACGVVPKP